MHVEISPIHQSLSDHHSHSLTLHHRFAPLLTVPKKYKNAGLRVRASTKSHPAASREDAAEPALGGLADEDAEAERPAMYPITSRMLSRPEFPENLQWDKARKNEVSKRVGSQFFPPNLTDILTQLVDAIVDAADGDSETSKVSL